MVSVSEKKFSQWDIDSCRPVSLLFVQKSFLVLFVSVVKAGAYRSLRDN